MSAVTATPARLVTLDALRGAMLVVMGINHIPAPQLHVMTNHPFGFVSAAEGFVFLSGLLVGLIYGRRAKNQGLPATRHALVQRVLTIYRAHLGCALGMFLWVQFYLSLQGQPPPSSPDLFSSQPVASVLATLTFVYRPGLLDILPMYCLLMALVPGILSMLVRGQRTWLFALSAITWLLTNLIDPRNPIQIGLLDTGAFNLGAWQFLFVLAVVFGYDMTEGRLPRTPTRPVLAGLVLLALFLFGWRHEFHYAGLSAEARDLWTNRNNLMPVRAANVALVLYLISLTVRRFPRVFEIKPLAFLGRESLLAFSVHVVVATVINGLPQYFTDAPAGRWLGPVVLVSAMFLAAYIGQLGKQRPTPKTRTQPQLMA